MKKFLVLLASSAEWYEFTIYTFCIDYIGVAFFPDLGSKFAIFLAAFGAFAAGFLARPIGGILFGYIGDKHSRTTALALSALLMGIPTVGMALLPSYYYIGVLAPIILVTFRIMQGIAIGGQYSGSVIILVEGESTVIGKAKASANVIASAFAGILLATVSFQLIRLFIPTEMMASGGWRILFAMAILLVVLSFFLKHTKGEDENNSKKSSANVRLVPMILQNYNSIIFMILMCLPGAVVAYFQITILPNILKKILHVDVNTAILTTIGLVFFIISCFIAARLIRFFRLKNIIAFGLVLMVLLPIPMYGLYKYNSDYLFVFFISMSIIFGIFYGNIMALFTECFPEDIRYTGFALSYNIGFGIYGGLLPFVCFLLADKISDYMAISVICISAIVGLLTLYLLEPKHCKAFTSLK